MRFLLISILSIFCIGCSSTTQYIADTTLNENNASTVYIYRTDVSFHSLNPEKPFFFLDDKLVGKLGTGQSVRFFVAPGEHTITSKESFLFTPGSQSGDIIGEFKSGETYYFRYSKDFSSIYPTGTGFVMSGESSLRPATKKSFDDKS